MIGVRDLVTSIRSSRIRNDNKKSYDTKSCKDEIAIAQAMMNDTNYNVDVYSGSTFQGVYNPAQSIRRVISSSISNITGMSRIETDNLVKNYEFTQNEAKEVLDFSKEFINTYLQTGRKLPLGGREHSNVSLKLKQVEPGFISYPVKVGEDNKGNPICESKQTYVGGYETIKVYGPWPQWAKEQSNIRRN